MKAVDISLTNFTRLKNPKIKKAQYMSTKIPMITPFIIRYLGKHITKNNKNSILAPIKYLILCTC
jgi:hypothetical protein